MTLGYGTVPPYQHSREFGSREQSLSKTACSDLIIIVLVGFSKAMLSSAISRRNRENTLSAH